MGPRLSCIPKSEPSSVLCPVFLALTGNGLVEPFERVAFMYGKRLENVFDPHAAFECGKDFVPLVLGEIAQNMLAWWGKPA